MKEFDELLKLIEKTRKECPWDREQTIKSMKKDLLDEAEEVVKAIDKGDSKNLKEEIGDLLWSLMTLVEIAKDGNLFDIKGILKDTNKKIVRRHPHVFGDKKAETAEDAVKISEMVKRNEKH